MRGALLVGLAAVLLIIGLLVMKNMGGDSPDAAGNTQAEERMEKAKNVAGDLDKRLKDIKNRRRGLSDISAS